MLPSLTDRIIRQPEILAALCVSRATLWRWAKNGNFPAPVKLGRNSVGWRASEVSEWLEKREKSYKTI